MSHYIELALKLFEFGIIPHGKFTMAETRHDLDCPALTTGSELVCNCDCEIVLDGESYLYSQIVQRRWHR